MLATLRHGRNLLNRSCFQWLQIISSIPENWKHVIIMHNDCTENHFELILNKLTFMGLQIVRFALSVNQPMKLLRIYFMNETESSRYGNNCTLFL